jgi:hypothetical protein
MARKTVSQIKARFRPITPAELEEHVQMLRWLVKHGEVTGIRKGLLPTNRNLLPQRRRTLNQERGCGMKLVDFDPGSQEAKYIYGLTESQLAILNNIADAIDGLTMALSQEEPGGGRTNPEREVFASMAEGIWGCISNLCNLIEKQVQ